jgi:uncharacterized protein YkwD
MKIAPEQGGTMHETDMARLSATRLRMLCLRLGALLTAMIACAAVPAFAAAHVRRPVPSRWIPRRNAVRSAGRTRVSHHRHRRLRAAGQHGACRDAHVRIGSVSRREIDRATLCLLNVQRKRFRLPTLRLSDRLDDSAQSWTNTMVHHHSFSHGSDFGARISATGFDWSQIGENIADGYRTPAGAVTAWMHSTGHCENILSPEFREVGAGFDNGTAVDGHLTGTWTLDLGLLMRQRAPSGNWRPAESCPY